MIALYLLAAHLVGDYVLQTRWQAARKLTHGAYRVRHVTAYCLPFVPIAAIYGTWGPDRHVSGLLFLLGLWLGHLAIDSRRFTSTLGDWIGWNLGGMAPPAEKRGVHAAMGAPLDRLDLPPNPWQPIALCIDQTLHVCQLALLGGLLLS